MAGFYQKIISELKKRDFSPKELAKLKRDLALKYKQERIPTNIEILLNCGKKEMRQLKKRLVTKPTRTISGVAPVALMSKPFPCPHAQSGVGPCIMCPGGPKSFFGEVPQSYTGKEPATMRGIRNRYDAYLQVFNRLEQYILLGHTTDKVELIVMGGTFPSFPVPYQEEFVWGAWKALNDFSKNFFKKGEFNFLKFKRFFELPFDNLGDEKRTKRVHQKLLKLKGKFTQRSLLKEQLKNEKAKIRGVALCIETRPDYCGTEEIKEMLKLGCTRVELGVQHLENPVLERIHRGHGVEETVEATRRLKDSFLKVGYHMMPGLPGSSFEKDKKMLAKLFEDARFRPDALKIYPCMVTKGTGLYELWQKGEYRPLNTEKAAQLIAGFKEKIPEYVRVLRVQRDIPTYQTVAGVSMTNLRQYIHQRYRPKCRCIRCREPKKEEINFKKIKIKIQRYQASEGEEYFIAAEETEKDLLLGFCRLRIVKDEAGIRELHVYGTAAGIEDKSPKGSSQAGTIGEESLVQHRGLGKRLLKEAEKIVKSRKIKELKVISGIGVKEYYRKLGYEKEGVYMVKLMN